MPRRDVGPLPAGLSPSECGALWSRVGQRLEALCQAAGGPSAVELEEATAVAREAARGYRADLADRIEIEIGWHDSITVMVDGQDLGSLDGDGRMSYAPATTQPAADTPPRDSPEFERGHRRFHEQTAALAAEMRRDRRRRAFCGVRVRDRAPRRVRTRSRERRSPRATRAGPRSSDGSGLDDDDPSRRAAGRLTRHGRRRGRS